MEVECKFKKLDESFDLLTKNDIRTLHDVIEEIEKLAAIDSLHIHDIGIEIPRRDGHSGEHVFVITRHTQSQFTAEYRGVQKYN
jgi:hypothetical protein